MDGKEFYSNLRFHRPAPRFAISSLTARRVIMVVGTAFLFGLLWAVVPNAILFWLLVPMVAGLVWVSGYGWRQALAAVHEALHRLL